MTTPAKIKMFSSANYLNLENSVNEFIKDKLVRDIKYQSFPIVTEYDNGLPSEANIIDRVLIIYEEVD